MDLQKFLRCQAPIQTQAAHRQLQSKHTWGVEKYCTGLEEWLDQSSIERDLENIFHRYQNPQEDKSTLDQQAISLESQFTAARLSAERSLRRPYILPWSPKLKEAQMTVFYYKLWLSQYKTNVNFQSQRDKLQLHKITEPHTIKQAQQYLRQAQKHLKETQLNADQLRDTHLEERSTRASYQGDIRKSQSIKQLRRMEQLSQMYSKIRYITKQGSSHKFTHMIINNNDEEQIITEPEDIF